MTLLILFCLFAPSCLAVPEPGPNICNQTEQPPLVQLPVQNVTVTGSNGRRGCPLTVGTPAQLLSFLPSVYVVAIIHTAAWLTEVSSYSNNTILKTSGQWPCTLPPAVCLILDGGAFNENISSSWLAASTMAQSGASSEDTSSLYPYTMDKWGQDILSLNSNLTLPSFPLDLTKQPIWVIQGLGLGMNSTILNRLKSMGAIASRSWSVWYGHSGYGGPADRQMDGIMVLGGYDASKIAGPRLDIAVQTGTSCRTNLVAPLIDMKMDVGGQSTSILDIPQLVCLDPGVKTLEISIEAYSRFLSLAGGTFQRNSSGIFDPAPVFDADNA